MSKLGFIFRSHPHSSSKGREGLDALLAASAYSEDISVFFVGEGVTQLIAEQNTQAIYSRDYSPTYKLMELYDIEAVYLCADSVAENGLKGIKLLVDAEPLSKQDLADKLSACDKLLSF